MDNLNTTESKKMFKKTLVLSPIEFYKYQLDQIINSQQQILTSTQITVLAYIHEFGMNSTKKILDDRILTNKGTVVNYLSFLHNEGYVIKEYGEKKNKYTNIYLNPKIKLSDADFIQITVVSKDESSDTVYHINFRR